MLPLLLLTACTSPSPDHHPPPSPTPSPVPWSSQLPPTTTLPPVRHLTVRRAIIHLHSPWSHDACDGEPLIDGSPDPQCLADLRAGLCDTAIDFAFLTDHPAHAADQPYDDLFLAQEGDPLDRSTLQIPCTSSHHVHWLPGIEDELMPVALDRHVSDDPSENDRIYNQGDAEALHAEQEAGAVVLMAHTEGRDLPLLETLQDAGLQGIEVFNLHAMFAPDLREERLGLDPLSWLGAIAPFTDATSTAEPDLLFLGVLQDQTPSLERWDALLLRGPMTGVAGTDAHQNVLPLPLKDGERGDSYRRMLRWFSNHLFVDGEGPEAAEQALADGRVYVAFEALGTPSGFDVHLVDEGGTLHEMGSDAPPGTLEVRCPVLHPSSPRGEQDPELLVSVLRDGQPWAEGCGSFEVAGPAVYRVRVDVVPHHLLPFLGEDPEVWLRPFPWLLSNAIRVVQDG